MRGRLGMVGLLAAFSLACPRESGNTTGGASSSGGVSSSRTPSSSRAASSADADGGTGSSGVADAGPADAAGLPDAAVVLEPSYREPLRWRTATAFEHHFMNALSLTEDEVCKELGLFKCVTRPASERPFRPSGTAGAPAVGVPIPHQIALGGNEPFDLGNMEPRRAPAATTPNAVDRVALAACDARVTKDSSGTPAVFVGWDLAADHVEDNAAFRSVLSNLFRRFHLRDATSTELDALATLRTPDNGLTPTAAEVALMVCVAVGGMSESSFD